MKRVAGPLDLYIATLLVSSVVTACLVRVAAGRGRDEEVDDDDAKELGDGGGGRYASLATTNPDVCVKNESVATSAASFSRFKRTYLIGYVLMVAGDWLQGAHVFSLYVRYGLSKAEIAQLFVVGFGASMVFGTFIGSLADSFGRKRFVVMYCIIYFLSCLAKHVNDYRVLAMGRLLGGVATSLLYSVLEAWLVAVHRSRGFGETRLRRVFSEAVFWNSAVAVAAGIIAQAAVSLSPLQGGPFVYWGGETVPFDLSAAALALGGAYVYLAWDDDDDDDDGNEPPAPGGGGVAAALLLVRDNRAVLLCGLVQSLFEGAMYLFVFEWTPALTKDERNPPPYGIIFATFMVACMAGSQLYELVATVAVPQRALVWVCLAAATSLAAAPLDDVLGTELAYFGMLGEEVAIGLYFPLISVVKSAVVPESLRSSVYNVFRVPLNAIVFVVLLNNSVDATLSICVVLLLVAAAIQMLLVGELPDALPGSAKASSQVSGLVVRRGGGCWC